MRFLENFIRDKRTRIYLPVRKVLCAEGVKDPGRLIGNREYQTVIHYLPEMTVFPPGSSILLDFGLAVHGGIRLNFFCRNGKIRVKFGESVSEALGESNQECSLKDTILDTPYCGMLEYGNTVFRFVQLENPGDTELRCLNIMAVALERDMEISGAFESSDERLNRIWMTAVRTVHLCMQDYLYDGAKRDRIVWMGDMHPEIKGVACAFADTSIIRDSLEFLIRQTPPGGAMNQISTYSCWFVISVWDYFMASGDRAFLERNGEYIRHLLETFAAFVDNRGAECLPERRFLDWPNNDLPQAKHAGIHALMYWMFLSGVRILDALEADSAGTAAARNKLAGYVPDPAGRKAPAALLTITGLADRRDVLEQAPFSDVSTFFGYYILLAKRMPEALELLRRYWGAMLDLGATSFWEDFDLKWAENAFGIDTLPVPGKKDIHRDFGRYCYAGLRHSLSHGWSCGPAPFLSERVLGVKFLEPGGSRISVSPEPTGLEYVKGSVPTPHGAVTVEIRGDGSFQVDAPTGVEVVTSQAKDA